jgi:hypothetical protein
VLLADTIPVEALLSIDSAIIIAIIYLARQLGKTREQVVRLEEWVRLHNKIPFEKEKPEHDKEA